MQRAVKSMLNLCLKTCDLFRYPGIGGCHPQALCIYIIWMPTSYSVQLYNIDTTIIQLCYLKLDAAIMQITYPLVEALLLVY